jgi:hypothetical protein
MKARVAASRGWPGERSTSCTIGGAVEASLLSAADRCKVFFLHASHSPPLEELPPQEHVRCSSLDRLGEKAGELDRTGFVGVMNIRPP